MNAKDLTRALSTLATARRELADATAARVRAEETVRSTQQQLTQLSSDDEVAVGRHAGRLEDWLRAGNSGAPPSLVADDRRTQARITAEHTLAAAQRALATLRRNEAAASTAVTTAELRRDEIRDTAKRAECDRIVTRLAELRAEELTLCARLFAVDAFSTDGSLLSPDAEAALNDPPCRPTPDALAGTPTRPNVNSSLAGMPEANLAASAFWAGFDAIPEAEAAAA